ncbi:MAG: hypothetical protein M4579_005615 [Chaenotheca gracillima]|nr:MAG: hypothetical protein M4579_005615 [Chaenotheca gracillima]
MPSTTAVSAPGKVLLAGGYLVLDRKYTGLVFGLDARIHVGVQHLPTRDGVSLCEIIVRSPQFTDAEWRYGYRLAEDDGGIEVTQLIGSSSPASSRNVFVETALAYALTYVSVRVSPHLEPASILILADNDYYSQSATTRSSCISQFANFHVPLTDAHKTGLGSSAALVTAFTAAVLSHYLPKDIFTVADDSAKTLVHNLAQAAHCAAQGKVGSGFDVAAAVYGSCIYKRFSPAVLGGIGEIGTAGFARRLRDVVESTGQTKWDTEVIKQDVAKIPQGLRLVMCDVDCGSQTVGMVKKVLKWRAENPQEADDIWGWLQEKNSALGEVLAVLVKQREEDPEAFDASLKTLADPSRPGGAPDIWNGRYIQLRTVLAQIRTLTRDMSSRSGVSIEPKPQTELLNASSAVTGVIGGVVPGAGGYDAIALLVVDEPTVLKGLEQFLAGWSISSENDDPQAKPGRVRMLGVREENEGVRVETKDLYASWL